MTDENDALFVMQREKEDNINTNLRDKKAIQRIMKETIEEAKKFSKDQLAVRFLQTTNNFKALNFQEMFGPAGKPNNSNPEFLAVKVLFRAMLEIHSEEINLSEFF